MRPIKKRQIFYTTCLLVAICGCKDVRAPSAHPDPAQRLANLHAFARLYGVVRWFHPSDAAATIDWYRFAVEGTRGIASARDTKDLHTKLRDLFKPIAPTMQIAQSGSAFSNEEVLHPPKPPFNIVAWQHRGYGDSLIATGYASKRLHRERVVPQKGAVFAALSQSLDATPFRGARVRLRGKLRTSHRGRGQLWLRVDRGDSATFFDNMFNRPVISSTWTPAEIIGPVADDATKIVFGQLMAAGGISWYDDLEFSFETPNKDWIPIEIKNGDFEREDLLESWHPGIDRQGVSNSIAGWNVRIDHIAPATGNGALRIEQATNIATEELFSQTPKPGEFIDIELGSDLKARVPIALYLKNNHTIGDIPEFAQRPQDALPVASTTKFDTLEGVADVIVFWNVFTHFWPYWDTSSAHWSAALDTAIVSAFSDTSIDDHVKTLEQLSTGAPDGHVSISCPGEQLYAYPPFSLDLVESMPVVTTSMNAAVRRGDVIISVDGHPADQLLATERRRTSGSSQWQTVRALQRFGRGTVGSNVSLRIRRDTQNIDITVTRIEQHIQEEPLHTPIERLEYGNYYIDMSRADLASIEGTMANLASAPGIVLDLRHYPKHNHDIISHIITHLDSLKGWEFIPLIIRPDSASTPAAWEDTSTWNMPHLSVKDPHITGRIAILTGPDAISYAESVMALIEHYRIGEIFGSPTAGTNGDIAQIDLPTGCTSWFTGRRVISPDGSRFHLLGIQPTVPVSRTITGVKSGRDEVLERALSYLRTGTK